MKAQILHLNYFRKGRATNSSSTHSVIYKNKGDIFNDLNVFEEDYYGRCLNTIAATKKAKIKYVFTCIYKWDLMAEALSNRYPQMTKYFELVKKEKASEDDSRWEPYIGEHSRGDLCPFNDFEITYQHLCNIIDNDEIVIVGGSDEDDFVNNTIDGHEKLGTTWFETKYENIEPFKNGNYYLGYSKYGDKIRLCVTKDNKPIPKNPELIDLLITKKCSHGCSFCYNNSNINGKHAEVENIRKILGKLNQTTEFSIGGGNILEHPQLGDIFEIIKKSRLHHIINVTIKVDDTVTILNNEEYKNIFQKYVDGIGVSIQKNEDIEKWGEFAKVFKDKFITIHLIPEIIGKEDTIAICNKVINIYLKNQSVMKYPHILYLGFKQTGRACNMDVHKFSNHELDEFFDCRGIKSIDTSFANNYKDYISTEMENMTVTYNEGEFSMYIDAVDMKSYRCSYDLSKPYDIPCDNWRINDVKKAFDSIRKDCGFDVYNDKNYKKYYEE